MMDIKLIYSFILLGTSSALAPGRNPLRTLAVENGNAPETSPAQLPAALADVVVQLAGVSAEEIETAQQHVEEAVSNMGDQMVAVAEATAEVDVDEVVKDVASQMIEEVEVPDEVMTSLEEDEEEGSASNLTGSFSTEDATNPGASAENPLPTAPPPASLAEVVVELAGVSAKEIETAQQNVEGAVSSMEDQMVAMAEELEQLSPEASFILLVEKEIEFVEELLTKLTKEGTETADISAMLKEVDVTMIEAKETDDPSNIAELLASSLESLAAIMEQMPDAEGMDLQEVTMTKTVGYSDFKTFVLQLKNVIKFCLLKHGGSTPSHKSKTSKVTYKSEKENWKEECLGALKGYKLSSALLGLKDFSEVMADAIGMDISAMDMESVAQDTTEATTTTISVSKFQAYDSSGMRTRGTISSILVASAFIVLL
jgi:hypothetical protein